MKANNFSKSLLLFLIFLSLSILYAMPFFVVFKESIKDYFSIFMLLSAITILLYDIKKNKGIVKLTLHLNRITLITLVTVLVINILHFAIFSIDNNNLLLFNKRDILILISIIIIGPLAEEIIFRQLLFRHLIKAKGFLISALFTSFIFAIIHIKPIIIVSAFLTSLIISYNFYKKESLLEVYLIHSLANLVAIAIPSYYI